MKPSVPSIQAALNVLKTIFFHPMLYGAMLLHWAVIQQPLPAAKVQEPELEEVLPEAVSIAQSNSPTKLSDKPKSKAKSGAKSTKEKNLEKNIVSKPKSEPKPLAQALAKNNPTPKAEPNSNKKEDSESPSEEQNKEDSESPSEEQNKSDFKENSEREDETAKKTEKSEDSDGVPEFFKDFADQGFFGGSDDEKSVGFNLQLLPQPELIFTSDSIQAYNSLSGDLVPLDNVFSVQWWKAVPQRDAVNQFGKKYPQYQVKQVGDYAGGSLYEMSQGDNVFYASFITNPAKKTLATSTAFVIWKSNPSS
jgi:outer membrane biosynthesis protein TonB